MSALTAAGALRSIPSMKTGSDDGRTIRRSTLRVLIDKKFYFLFKEKRLFSPAMSGHREEHGHECAARRAARGRTVAAAVLLAASTLAFAASSSSSAPARGGGWHALLSVSGTVGSVGEQSLITRAAARVSSMLTDSNPAMALDSVRVTPGNSAVGQPPPSVLAASLAGERAKLLASMLAKEDAAAEIPLKAAAALRAPAARVQQLAAHADAALNADKNVENHVREAMPARLQALQGTSRPAQLEQTVGQNAQTQASGGMVQVPESVVQQMEQQIAQLSAKVETLEHKQAADTTTDEDEYEMGNVRDRAVHAPSSVAFASPAQAKAAALARLSVKSSAPVAQRAAAAVNALINAHAARGGASKRAAAMVDSLISARLVQNGDAPAARETERPAAGARSSAEDFSIKGAYRPAAQGTRAPDKITKMLHAFSNRVKVKQAATLAGVVADEPAQYPARQPSQYPQAPTVQFPSLPTEAPVSTATSSNLAAMESLPTPSKDTIYYPGEQTHLRAQAAMTPQALAQPNLPPSVVQQTGTGLYARNPYSPVPMARPPLPDPMPTGYGATSTTGVQDHLFDIYSSKKNAEEYLGGAGGGAGASGAIMAPTGVAMASASGGSSGDGKGSDPFDDAMFNVIHDCSLGGPGC